MGKLIFSRALIGCLVLLFFSLSCTESNKSTSFDISGYYNYWVSEGINGYCEMQIEKTGDFYIYCLQSGLLSPNKIHYIESKRKRDLFVVTEYSEGLELDSVTYSILHFDEEKLVVEEEKDNIRWHHYRIPHPEPDIKSLFGEEVKGFPNQHFDEFSKNFLQRAHYYYKIHFEDSIVDTKITTAKPYCKYRLKQH